MGKILQTIIVIILLSASFVVHGQENLVEKFKINQNKVSVFFYDPLMEIIKTENYAHKTDKEKSDLLDDHLHNNVLYLFEVKRGRSKDLTYFCIRGNPDKVDTKMFYKVEVIKGIEGKTFDPNVDSYSDKIVQVIDEVNCGGTLFENMALFSNPQNQKFVGKGIMFFKYFRRVQPYSEIKSSMVKIIKQFNKGRS